MKTCFICGTEGSSLVSSTDRHGKPLDTRVCDGCGLVFNDPVPTDEELKTFYSVDYRRDYKGARLPRVRQVIRNCQRLERHVAKNWAIYQPVNRVLDIGAGSGEFLFLMKSLGKDGQGLEPNLDYSAYDREHLGLNVQTGDIYLDEFPKGGFDLIRLSHVMEHLNDPVRALKRMREWLAPGGVLYIETPDIDTEWVSKRRGTIFHYGHIWNLNGSSQQAIAGMAGLEPVPGGIGDGDNFGAFYRAAKVAKGKPNPDNAAKVKGEISRHYGKARPAGMAVAKGFRQLGQRISEIVEARKIGSQRAAADHYGQKLRTRLGL